MAFTGNFVATSFKTDLLGGKHNFTSTTGNAFKMALYTNTATLTAATTDYTSSTTGEHPATGTYTTTGKALVLETSPAHPRVPSGTTAVADFQDLTWATSTINAYGALIYNDTQAGKNAVVILDFLGLKASSSGDFVVQFPVADATNAIIRIA
jgi:hypothetical protein